MKHCLLLCAAVLALAIAMPASAQYVFLDTNGDGVCNSLDVITSATTSIDFWIDTNHNADGSVATCATGEDLTINSYSFVMTSSGGITYGAWTDDIGFTIPAGFAQAGNDYWVVFASGTILPPGKYKCGHLAVTVSGNPTLTILQDDPPLDGNAFTGFGSACLGRDFTNTMYLGFDFTDVCSSSSGIAVQNTTWGKIKDLYKDK